MSAEVFPPTFNDIPFDFVIDMRDELNRINNTRPTRCPYEHDIYIQSEEGFNLGLEFFIRVHKDGRFRNDVTAEFNRKLEALGPRCKD